MLTTSTPIIWIVVITLGFGVTLGAIVSANQTTLFHQVAPDQIGTASGLFKTFGSIGSIASSALIAIAFHTSVSDTHGPDHARRQRRGPGYRDCRPHAHVSSQCPRRWAATRTSATPRQRERTHPASDEPASTAQDNTMTDPRLERARRNPEATLTSPGCVPSSSVGLIRSSSMGRSTPVSVDGRSFG